MMMIMLFRRQYYVLILYTIIILLLVEDSKQSQVTVVRPELFDTLDQHLVDSIMSQAPQHLPKLFPILSAATTPTTLSYTRNYECQYLPYTMLLPRMVNSPRILASYMNRPGGSTEIYLAVQNIQQMLSHFQGSVTHTSSFRTMDELNTISIRLGLQSSSSSSAAHCNVLGLEVTGNYPLSKPRWWYETQADLDNIFKKDNKLLVIKLQKSKLQMEHWRRAATRRSWLSLRLDAFDKVTGSPCKYDLTEYEKTSSRYREHSKGWNSSSSSTIESYPDFCSAPEHKLT